MRSIGGSVRERPGLPNSCHSVSQEPELRDAGVSRFAENGSHLAEAGAAEGHAGHVGGPGSSGNAENGSHLAEVNAAESYARHVGGPGGSEFAKNGSHLADTGAARPPRQTRVPFRLCRAEFSTSLGHDRRPCRALYAVCS